jgi:type II secretory pathway pseudopilin PulG
MRGTLRNSVEGPVPAGTPADRRRSEAGDTLVEVLLAIVVLGLTSVALLTAFGTMISSSAEYRGLATMDTVLRSASEQAISQVGQQSALFASCGSAGPSGPGQVNFSLPAGYTAVVSSVQYWNASATPPAFNPPSTWSGTSFSPCIPNAPALLTITVTAASSGASSSIRSVVDEQQGRSVTGAGAATQLVFLTEPGNGTAGSNLSPQPAVAVEDANGNIVYSDLSDVQLTISGGPSGATLSDTCTGSEFYGVVTFSDCSVNTAGTGYSLTATDGALQSATSSTFNVTP